MVFFSYFSCLLNGLEKKICLVGKKLFVYKGYQMVLIYVGWTQIHHDMVRIYRHGQNPYFEVSYYIWECLIHACGVSNMCTTQDDHILVVSTLPRF